ncbi:DUF3526 domain-containing protein [Janthinobacterium fluminis]|uniref:DUF3526 domain-containing protein n=1 Tax=Janthinobacterium fluminis TaxID=2987524 RepID=A0ABT5JX42_9BURK|nr:DUF3526 domain-containing protein [Janthinobacterium fluminis]MDC8757291.1 DUF3526 domain-containing protein [Janthinobacterium fluminis]
MNATTLARSPAAAEGAPPSGWRRWRSAFAGAWQADWRERRRDWRVWLVLGIGLALAVCAALLTALDVRDTLAARAQAQQGEQRRWLNQGKKNPHSAAHYGVYVFKPLSPLAALDPGVEHYVGSSVWLEAHKQNEFVYRPANDEPGMARQFALSPALVLQVLTPMALIFLGFGMFAAERESGTLGNLRINAAPLGAIALARGAVLLCLGLVMALPACAAVAALQWGVDGGAPFSDGGTRALLFGAAALLYLCTWCALITAVSAWMPGTRTSLAVLIALWAGAALVLPRVALELAQAAAPLPSMQSFREQMDGALGMPDDPAEAERHKQAILREYGVGDVRDLPLNWAGISLRRGEEHGNRVFDAHYGRLFGAMQGQSDAAAWAGWLSPTVALAALSGAAAASDTAHHIQFVRAAEAQRRVIQDVLNEAITRHPEHDGKKFDGDQSLWKQVPPFRFAFAPLAWGGALRHSALALLALFGASLLWSVLAVRRLRYGSIR